MGIAMPSKGSVTVKDTVRCSVTEHWANLWTLAQMKEHHPEEKCDKVTTIRHMNTLVKGILKPPSFGWADGVLKLQRESMVDVV